MNAIWLMVVTLCVFALAYRYYSAFLAARVMVLFDGNPTPAHTHYDGQNYFPTNRWVLFGHHFAAIAGAGPLIGPVLAAQFGFLPGFLWLLTGVVLGGAVHDFIILSASVRRDGKSLAEIARTEIGPVSGFVCALAILVIVIVALAGLGFAVVNALKDSAWGAFTIAVTIPVALFMGWYMYRFRVGKIAEASVIGIVCLIGAVVVGGMLKGSPFESWFLLSSTQVTIAMGIYGLVASILPVWLLLCPRDYLSAFMKLGTIGVLVIGVLLVQPTLKMPALTEYVHGGGPIVPGKVFPFVFITIACGAISGFHALVGSGTTPKMIACETDCRAIGYGSMLLESLVGVVALIAACSLEKADYFAINVPVDKFAALGMVPVHLNDLGALVGENVAGRTGGAVSLAIGMAQIFTGFPGMRGLLAYWYHFVIMFEALFILTTIDTGTRVARFMLQEFAGRFYKPFGRADWLPGTIVASVLVVAGWVYFILTGSISTIWPMFGIANQLLAAVALCVGTTVIINSGRARYAWATLLPLSFVGSVTLTAGYLSIRDIYLPLARSANSSQALQGFIDAGLTAILMVSAVVIMIDSVYHWVGRLRARGPLAVET
ncbi:MAG TPA: carbon starvation CstA family protein [Blastocatellia bacterium]|nr:carbon starvation CstA family protein [Blastocatellia bacterium]